MTETKYFCAEEVRVLMSVPLLPIIILFLLYAYIICRYLPINDCLVALMSHAPILSQDLCGKNKKQILFE